MRGASAIENVLKQYTKPDVFVIAVWEPILPSDMSRPGAAILSRLSDGRAQQYYDANHLVAGDLAKAIAKDAQFPKPSCCIRSGYYWDLVAVFPKGSQWNDSLPTATFIDGPVVGAEEGMRRALAPR